MGTIFVTCVNVEVLEKRREAASKGQGTTHWPHEYRCSDRSRRTLFVVKYGSKFERTVKYSELRCASVCGYKQNYLSHQRSWLMSDKASSMKILHHHHICHYHHQIIIREVDWVNSGGEKIPSQQPSPSLQPEHWALVWGWHICVQINQSWLY